MARRKKGGAEMGGANWMDTYGDLVTLLLCFFVLLYSMSSMDESKWQLIAQAFSSGQGDIINVVVSEEPNVDNDPNAVYINEGVDNASTEIDFDDFYMYLKEAVASAGLDDSVSVEMAQTGVYMKFRDSVFFAGDSDVLLDEGQFILEVICDGIRAVDNHVLSIKVSGHTAESSGSSANEWRLSSGRADSVINYMLSLDCCDPSKFSAAGYGKYRPIADNDTYTAAHKQHFLMENLAEAIAKRQEAINNVARTQLAQMTGTIAYAGDKQPQFITIVVHIVD